MEKKFILFDFDGVVVDSFEIAYETRITICPHVTKEEYKSRFEGNINDYKAPASVHTAECQLEANWFDIYVPKMERAPVVPGMEEVLKHLAEKYTLIVVSSTITVPIQDLLKREGLSHYFTEVMGNDVHTSKIEKIKMIFDKYKTTPESCVFITDTLGDMREAEKTGVDAIGVTWGFHSPETLEKGNPVRLVTKAEDLIPAIESYFSKTT
jgi:phosphoglycolate phosphatase